MMLLTTKAKILVRLERNFSRDFVGAHASGVHVVAVGSPFARWKRALPGIRAAPGLCGEIFGCGRAAPWVSVFSASSVVHLGNLQTSIAPLPNPAACRPSTGILRPNDDAGYGAFRQFSARRGHAIPCPLEGRVGRFGGLIRVGGKCRKSGNQTPARRRNNLLLGCV